MQGGMNLLIFMELSYPVCYMGFYVRKAAVKRRRVSEISAVQQRIPRQGI